MLLVLGGGGGGGAVGGGGSAWCWGWWWLVVGGGWGCWAGVVVVRTHVHVALVVEVVFVGPPASATGARGAPVMITPWDASPFQQLFPVSGALTSVALTLTLALRPRGGRLLPQAARNGAKENYCVCFCCCCFGGGVHT